MAPLSGNPLEPYRLLIDASSTTTYRLSTIVRDAGTEFVERDVALIRRELVGDNEPGDDFDLFMTWKPNGATADGAYVGHFPDLRVAVEAAVFLDRVSRAS